MRSYLRKLGLVVVGAGSIVIASLAATPSADARSGFHRGFHHHHGFRGHRGFGFGPAFGGALAFGALTSPYWYSAPVAYYDDCFPRRRIVGYTPWGRPIIRIVRTCYY